MNAEVYLNLFSAEEREQAICRAEIIIWTEMAMSLALFQHMSDRCVNESKEMDDLVREIAVERVDSERAQ